MIILYQVDYEVPGRTPSGVMLRQDFGLRLQIYVIVKRLVKEKHKLKVYFSDVPIAIHGEAVVIFKLNNKNFCYIC